MSTLHSSLPCTGDSQCEAARHLHGCFADKGNCDHPSEHRSTLNESLPPHDHTIEPGEINRRGCRRCEIERERRMAELGRYRGTSWDREWQERGKDHP